MRPLPPVNNFKFQQARLNFATNGVALSLGAFLAALIVSFALASSGVMRVSISLPLLGLLFTAALARIYEPWLKNLELERRDRNVAIGACLGVNLIPPLSAAVVVPAWSLVFWVFSCLVLFVWMMWFMGGRKPIRSEVEGLLAYGQGLVTECKEALEQIEKDRPSDEGGKAKAAEVERIKKERDERLTVLEEAMRNPDEPLDPVTASAQFQQIQTDYREALGRTAS